MMTAQQLAKCTRCGGAGGSSHWPGITCFRCGGSGVDPSLTVEEEQAQASIDGAAFKKHLEREERERAERRVHWDEARIRLNPELVGIQKDEKLWGSTAQDIWRRAEMMKLTPRQIKVIQNEVKKWDDLRKKLGVK